MIKLAVPLLHVSNAAAAQDFYCTRLGFHLEYAHGPNGADGDPCYLGLSRDGVWIALSSFSGDGVAGGVVNLLAGDVDALLRNSPPPEFPSTFPPTDQTWGTREMYVKDADRNCLRFQQ
jgi:catechol 2,3-dioxygenase-like lactoylglutathione lyase family enzyme